MRITVSINNRRQRKQSGGKKGNWFEPWKAKKVAEGTWKDEKSNKKGGN